MRRSDLSNYGSGVVLYFAMMKLLAITFFLMALLSIPSLILFFSANPQGMIFDIRDAFSLFTLGNLGSCK